MPYVEGSFLTRLVRSENCSPFLIVVIFFTAACATNLELAPYRPFATISWNVSDVYNNIYYVVWGFSHNLLQPFYPNTFSKSVCFSPRYSNSVPVNSSIMFIFA